MYNHHEIKGNAKSHMKGNTNAIIVSLIVTFLGGGGFGGFGGGFGNKDSFASDSANDTLSSSIPDEMILIFAIAFFVILALAVSFALFISYPITVGAAGWFRRSINDKNPPAKSIFNTFKGGHYLTTISTMLLMGVYIFLWSLLCFIPGIIKSYSYSMVPYIKSENPNLSAKRCIEISSTMTNGHKSDLFYLDLSFIGWLLLGGLTCGILNIVYVNPYMYTAKAYAYEALKAEAIASGKLSEDEFVPYDGGYYPDDDKTLYY